MRQWLYKIIGASLGRLRCPHQLVETGKSGDGPVYTCRLCGATLYGKGATIEITRLWQHWFFALAFLAISSSAFILRVLPALSSGKMPRSWIRRDDSPVAFWAYTIFLVSCGLVTLAVSIWQFSCIWKKIKGKNHVP